MHTSLGANSCLIPTILVQPFRIREENWFWISVSYFRKPSYLFAKSNVSLQISSRIPALPFGAWRLCELGIAAGGKSTI